MRVSRCSEAEKLRINFNIAKSRIQQITNPGKKEERERHPSKNRKVEKNESSLCPNQGLRKRRKGITLKSTTNMNPTWSDANLAQRLKGTFQRIGLSPM